MYAHYLKKDFPIFFIRAQYCAPAKRAGNSYPCFFKHPWSGIRNLFVVETQDLIFWPELSFRILKVGANCTKGRANRLFPSNCRHRWRKTGTSHSSFRISNPDISILSSCFIENVYDMGHKAHAYSKRKKYLRVKNVLTSQ